MINITPELLAPAGGQEQLETALLYGADAVYLGASELSLRGACQGFRLKDLGLTIQKVHNFGARVYYCLNVLPQDNYLGQIKETLTELNLLQPDALIVADPGVLYLARKYCANIPLHLSTQAHSCNGAAVEFWQEAGVKRINLARELNLKAIRRMVKAYPEVEFEAFTHGALCLALSGHCLLSEWVNKRHANMGLCTQPCRFSYKEMANEGWQVEESTRPGETMFRAKIHENPEAGVYSSIWAPYDQALIRYLAWFKRVGVQSLKIEGRTKSAGYVAQVVDTYRTGLNLVGTEQYRTQIKELQSELVDLSSRPLGTGFFVPGRRIELGQAQRSQVIVAKVEERLGSDHYKLQIKYRWQNNYNLQLLIPGKRQTLQPSEYVLENHKGESVEVLHSGMPGYLRANVDLEPGYFLRVTILPTT